MQQGFHPHAFAPARPTPPKKGLHGCVIALIVGVGLLAAAVVGGGIYVYYQFDDYVDVTGDMAELMLEAERTPGAFAMRKRGCQRAYALETAKSAKVKRRLEEVTAKRERRAAKPVAVDEDGWDLTCDVELNPLKPADVAKVFVEAQKPTTTFRVTVKNAFATREERFTAAGVSMGTTGAPATPPTR